MWLLKTDSLSAVELRKAKYMLIKYSQKELINELRNAVESSKGRLRKIAPVLDDDVWRVAAWIKNRVPFTLDSKMPVLLPLSFI